MVNAAELSSKRRWLTLVAMVFGLFMPMLDNLVVNVALPTMQRSLNAEVSDLQWIIDAYTLTFASFMLTGGSLGDLYGRKKFFMAGLVIFSLASLGCGTSESTDALIAFRAVQGLGAALLLPGSLSILTATFRGKELGSAIGIWAAMSGLAVAVGPLVGGYLVEHHSWESIFFINLPVGVIGLILTAIVVKESRDTRGLRRIDLPGLVTGTAGVFFLVYALIEGGSEGWTDERILWSFGLSALFLVVFMTIEAKRQSPMLPLRFYRNPTFAASQVVAAAVFFALFGTTFFLALYLQNVRGFSPFETGIRLFPFTVAILILAPISGKLSDKHGSHGLMTIGTALAACGIALLLRTDPTSDYLTVILPAFIVLGSGMALTMAPMTAAVMNSVEPEHAGVASAATNTTRELGGVLGIALLGAVVTSSFREHLVTRLTESGLSGPAAASIADKAGSNAASGGGSLATFRSQVPPGTSEAAIERVVGAAQSAFVDAMHSGMMISIGFMVVASLVAFTFVRSHVARRAGDAQRAPLPPGPTTRQMPAASRPVTKPAPALPAPLATPAAGNGRPSRQDVADRMRYLMYELPFKAGTEGVEDHLTEIARTSILYYEHGAGGNGSLPLGLSEETWSEANGDLGALSGYLTLEQRLGRISTKIAPDLVAALLMGALAAHALGRRMTGEGDEESLEFATGMVRILMEGIAGRNGQRSVERPVQQPPAQRVPQPVAATSVPAPQTVQTTHRKQPREPWPQGQPLRWSNRP